MKMLSRIVAVALGVLLFASVSMAGSTNTVTNALNQVITVVTDNYGVHITSIVPAGLPASQSRTRVPMQSDYQYDSVSSSTTNTLYTPRDIGDMLIGKTLGTGSVWIAVGITASDWKLVNYVP